MFVPMILQWFPVSVIPVGSVLTTPMQGVRPTTVEVAMQSTMTREETMSLTTALQEQVHVQHHTSSLCIRACMYYWVVNTCTPIAHVQGIKQSILSVVRCFMSLAQKM